MSDPRPGEAITVADVMVHAKKNGCSLCRHSPAGPGTKITVPVSVDAPFAHRNDDGTISEGVKKVTPPGGGLRACGCAVTRFLAAHGADIEGVKDGGIVGNLRWKPLEFTTTKPITCRVEARGATP